jgi:hypothetical protein
MYACMEYGEELKDIKGSVDKQMRKGLWHEWMHQGTTSRKDECVDRRISDECVD